MVGKKAVERGAASRILCFAHKAAPYCIPHPIHHQDLSHAHSVPPHIYIWRVPNFPPNLHFQRWNIPPPWMVGKRGVVAFSSGEGTVDWVRIQRLVKGCPTATNTTVALQLHWNQFLASITLLLACWTFHIGCQLKNTFHYNYSKLLNVTFVRLVLTILRPIYNILATQ